MNQGFRFNLPAACVALVLAGLGATPAWAEPLIQAITAAQQAGADVVRVQLSEPLAAPPTGFAVQSPARVAIDLPGVVNAMGKNSVEFNQGNLREVRVASSGERTRLVMNLRQAATYQTAMEGNTLVITLAGPAPSAGPAETFAVAQNEDALALQAIDFRRGQDGAGRVVVTLASTQQGVNLRQQGKSLIIEFPRSSLPERLRRRLDVTDFGSPVQSLTASQAGDRVRIAVDAVGNWEHSAYQTDNQFVLEVRPVKTDPNKLVQGPGYQGEKLSLNFQNIDVRALLQVIADFSKFNVVTSETVAGNLTLRLKDVPWDHALDIILQAKGLGVKKNGNVLWVAPKEELAVKEQSELEARKKLTELEPLRTQAFQLNYTRAEDVSRMLNGQTQRAAGAGGTSVSTRLLSARGSVTYEQRTNQLFVTDVPTTLEDVSSMIAKIDVPVRQVMIEARIVEADDTFGRTLGVKLGSSDMRGLRGGTPGYGVGGNNYITVGGNYSNVGVQTLQTPNTATSYNDTQFVNLPAPVTGFSEAAATLAFSLFSASANRFLNLELSALEAEGKGKIVSSPRVVTADQVKALISQGEQIPYQVATSSGATSIQFKDATLKLEVTPQITPDGGVILDVDVAKDSRGASTPAGPAIDKKQITTKVMVENGGTVVIGGIYIQDERDEVNKVPFLGDVPYLGNLFKNKVRSSRRTELLVFITPKVVTERAITAR
ncbi:MAG: type IV pilus secretin PilQ [Proteobacteria bacterium]|nr:type IV pilus secretin PilQ [Pseudomonadota bacterium]